MPQKYTKKPKAQRATKKGWAEGAREDFLNQHVDDFATAMGKGAAAEEEALRKVVRQYFYHFDLDDTIEPTLPLKDFEESWMPPVEEGTLEELRTKRALREKKIKVSVQCCLCATVTNHGRRLFARGCCTGR